MTTATDEFPSAVDLILTDGRVHTLDANLGTVQAIAISKGRVVHTGTTEEVRDLAGSRTEILPLEGRVVLPGLIDAHLHLEQLACSAQRVDCSTPTLEECLARVKRQCRQAAPGTWILGHGWDQNQWGQMPDRWTLDRHSAGHPVYLTAKSLHAGWVNSRGLSEAGLDRDTLDPTDGALQRDGQGELTGILTEGAMLLVSRALPKPTLEETVALLELCQVTLWAHGLTGVHDFDGPSCLQALQVLTERGQLGLRVLKSLPLEMLDAATALGLRSGFGDEWLRIGAIKVFADGALGPRTAAMLSPYVGEPQNRGRLLQDRESLFEIGRRAFSAGLALAVHAIGDRANREVLAAFGALRREAVRSAPPSMASRIEHVQLLHPGDMPRLGQLGLVASMQPVHATSDMLMADRYWGTRTTTSYAWRSLEAAGTTLVFGSDAPVESPNPFWGMYAAVTRRGRDGSPAPDGWIPEQRLTRASALRAYTAAPAALAGAAGHQGVLCRGAHADLILLKEDPLTCPEDRLHALRPCGTMVAGIWRYRAF
jgi:predicted amidohydrolase YtcJ